VRLWCAFYSILLVLYVLSYVSERNVAPDNMPIQSDSEWSCIDFEHSMSIIVVADIHHFGG